MIEDLLSSFLESLVTIWAPALISGFVLLWIHHSKLRQEIEVNMRMEQLERRRSVYKELLAFLNQVYDYTAMLSDEPLNWRIFRELHDELQVIGSSEVIRKFNDLFMKFGSEKPSSESERRALSDDMKDLTN